MSKKRLPIGISDFKDIIDGNYYYVDKTLLIKEILESGAAATLFPRPRRFGKTLNMTMLRYFFEKTEQSNLHLFADLAVTQYPDVMQHQGKYPVIFLSFKDAKGGNWLECWSIIKDILDIELKRCSYLLESLFIDEDDKKWLKEMLGKQASHLDYQSILFKLSRFLYAHHKVRPIILIDEYDASINHGYINNYYDKVVNFMSSFLSAGLKDNSNLHFAVMTGILRVAKESIFSGLNNLLVCSMLSQRFADKFGLLEEEVFELVDHFKLAVPKHELKVWYNGYTSGKYKVYNPWSVISMVYNHGTLGPYWVNTSSNDIIKEIVRKADDTVKETLGVLINGGSCSVEIIESIVYGDVWKNKNSLWNFMLFSGYLTFDHVEWRSSGGGFANLSIPNKEVSWFFQSTIRTWFEESAQSQNYQLMLKNLLNGSVEDFSELFEDVVSKSLSYFDVSGENPENFYHAFVLGILVSLSDSYEVKSNRESGLGRYDVMIIPKDLTKLGIIIEFKKVRTKKGENLEIAAQNALLQIQAKNYAQEMRDRGISNILELGIAFEGKNTFVLAK